MGCFSQLVLFHCVKWCMWARVCCVCWGVVCFWAFVGNASGCTSSLLFGSRIFPRYFMRFVKACGLPVLRLAVYLEADILFFSQQRWDNHTTRENSLLGGLGRHFGRDRHSFLYSTVSSPKSRIRPASACCVDSFEFNCAQPVWRVDITLCET